MTVILLSEIVWEKFRPNTGCFEPLLFHFPDYSKGKRVQEAYQMTDSEYVITSSLYYITVAQAYQCVHVNINEDQICQWPQVLYNNDYFAWNVTFVMRLKLKVHVLGFFGISKPTVTQSQNRQKCLYQVQTGSMMDERNISKNLFFWSLSGACADSFSGSSPILHTWALCFLHKHPAWGFLLGLQGSKGAQAPGNAFKLSKSVYKKSSYFVASVFMM